MWSEEEMRHIDPPVPVRTRTFAPSLRADLVRRNRVRALSYPHDRTGSSIIYAPTQCAHGNFMDQSYRRICANPEWRRRLIKPHTAKGRGRLSEVRESLWCELDAATSSDALLMNIFCYPRVLATTALPAILGVPPAQSPIFGYKPRIPLHRNLIDTTEIDMKLSDLFVEAKLTESGFQSAPLRKLRRYMQIEEVFDLEFLQTGEGSGRSERAIPSYQLIRGVLAAHVHQTRFALLCDARRPDLIEAWFQVMRAVRSYEMQSRLRLYTWQELSYALPVPLRDFLSAKYGIHS